LDTCLAAIPHARSNPPAIAPQRAHGGRGESQPAPQVSADPLCARRPHLEGAGVPARPLARLDARRLARPRRRQAPRRFAWDACPAALRLARHARPNVRRLPRHARPALRRPSHQAACRAFFGSRCQIVIGVVSRSRVRANLTANCPRACAIAARAFPPCPPQTGQP